MVKHFSLLMLVVFLNLCSNSLLVANSKSDQDLKCPVDTIRQFKNSIDYTYRLDSSKTAIASRYSVQIGSELFGIRIHLAGNKGRVLLRIFGDEHLYPVPYEQKDLTEPVIIEKVLSGYEVIDYKLNNPLKLQSTQFFICLEKITEGIKILTDNNISSTCSFESHWTYFNQAIKKCENCPWSSGEYNFKIEPIITTNVCSEPLFSEKTDFIKFDQEFKQRQDDFTKLDKSYIGISCIDVNNDGFQDVLWKGRLFINNNGQELKETGLLDKPENVICNIRIDVNADGRQDIVVFSELRENGLSKTKCSIHLNQSSFMFIVQHESYEKFNINYYTICDVNSDNYPDIVFVDKRSTSFYSIKILLNSKGQKFELHELQSMDIQFNSINGILSLYNIYTNQPNVFISCTDSLQCTRIYRLYDLKVNGGNVVSSNYHLVYQNYRSIFKSLNMFNNQDEKFITLIDAVRQFNSYPNKDNFISLISVDNYLDRVVIDSTSLNQDIPEFNGNNIVGDLDNNGYTDFILLTENECNTPTVYLQNEKKQYTKYLLRTGLEYLKKVEDALLVDINNDGVLDLLCQDKNGVLTVLLGSKRQYEGLSINIREQLSTSGIRLHLNEKESTFRKVINGRGELIQDPMSYHFGLGDNKPDSIMIEVNNNKIITLKQIPYNLHVYDLSILSNDTSSCNDLIAEPNPFISSVTFKSLNIRNIGQISIYNLNGKLIKHITSGSNNISNVLWDGCNEVGTTVESGVYLVKYLDHKCTEEFIKIIKQ